MMTDFKSLLLTICVSLFSVLSFAQNGKLTGKISDTRGQSLGAATIAILQLNKNAVSDNSGKYEISDIPYGTYHVELRFVGLNTFKTEVILNSPQTELNVTLKAESHTDLDEVVVSGTMKEVSKLESPVPVEVYTSKFFRANPTPSIFDALQNVNGVRPQLNCNVCNTGDIHINGLEGPYTMILIDGMPIVSGLSTVYGLSGIPQSLIDRVEIVKGPASTLYGSEAVGGLINIITKRPGN